MNWETRTFKRISLGFSCSLGMGAWLLIGSLPTLAQEIAPSKNSSTTEVELKQSDDSAVKADTQKQSVTEPDKSSISTERVESEKPESNSTKLKPQAESDATVGNPKAGKSVSPESTETTQPESAPSDDKAASERKEPQTDRAKPQADKVSPQVTTISATPGQTIRLPRPAAISADKIAVFLGRTDITSQVEIKETEIIYRPKLLSVGLGSQTATIYKINSPQDWQTVKQVKLQVTAIASAPGAEKSGEKPEAGEAGETGETSESTEKPEAGEAGEASETGEAGETGEAETGEGEGEEEEPSTSAADLTITPTLNINVKSQFSEFRSPDAGTSERPIFNDATFTGGLEAKYEKGPYKLGAKFNLLGVTFQPEALRFGDLQQAAPQLDLSEYVLNLAAGPASLDVGHVCYGNHPLLVASVCTRGLTAKVKLNEAIDFSLGRISSTGVVGFDNIVGLERDENALTSATLGLQILKNSNGGVRLETSWMQGQRSPVSNFNVGEVVDAEKSDGFGLRLTATDESGRLKGDAGFARSTFTNPSQNDPELTEGLDVVEVVPITRNAWFTEASYDVIQGLKLDENRDISLSVNFRKERIDPQFGTLGAGVTADALQTTYGFNATIAGASFQFQENTSEDNLANVINILKTRSRNKSLNVSAPLQDMLQVQSPLLPTLTYGWQQSKQKGSIIAALDGGFNDESQIPEQENVTQQAGLSWNIDNLTLSYQYSNAFQDNRQLGRENADFRNISNQFSVGLQASPTMSFSIGYGVTRVEDIEQAITRFSHAPTFGFNWEFVKDLTFAMNFNRNDDTDSRDEAFARSEGIEMLLTWRFNVKALGRDLPGSFFIRYGRQSSLSQNFLFAENTDSTIHTVNGGFSFSF